MVKRYIIIMVFSIILISSSLDYNISQAQPTSEKLTPQLTPMNNINENCVNPTNMTADYLTITCRNTLTETNNTASDLNCATSTGWYVVCAWLEQNSNSNSSLPNQISVSSSQDGGQSYNKPLQNLSNFNSTNSEVQNLEVGLSQEHAYIKWEQLMGTNNFDVFLAISDNGGRSYNTPDNLSNSPTNSISSILLVDQLTGKYVVTWIEVFPDGTAVVTDCGRC